MRHYDPYNKHLEQLVGRKSISSDDVHSALNGGANKALSTYLDPDARKQSGAFFTSSAISEKLLKWQLRSSDVGMTILDPTCGAGDLLIAAARKLPIMQTPKSTLRVWGRHLAGIDIHPEFVHAARLRLALLAKERSHGGALKNSDIIRLLPQVRVSDVFEQSDLIGSADHILLNPPYTKTQVKAGCGWATGSANAASIVMDHVQRNAKHGSLTHAILPDVLRSGSRYRKWRSHIEVESRIVSLMPHGLFHSDADVDVFLARFRKGSKSANGGKWPIVETPPSPEAPLDRRFDQLPTLADTFWVNVGSVVPYRAAVDGPSLPYIHPRNLKPWGTSASGSRRNEYRRFSGRTFRAPFVAIRRTSRPGDIHRAVPTIVTGRSEVAVENHLIVCTPKSGNLDDCRHLLRILRDPRTREWLDIRIRCRHLTVTSIGMLPRWQIPN